MTATIMQIAGATLVSVGAALIYLPLGIILAGTAALLFGIAMERS
jgi:hypothetical protein